MKRRGYTIFRAIDLIFKKLLGELSPEEQEAYKKLLKDTNLKEEDWSGDALSQGLSEDTRFDANESYKQFLKQVPRKNRTRRLILQAAAFWLIPLIIAGSIWFVWNQQGVDDQSLAQIHPVSSKAYIELADGSSIELTDTNNSLSEKDGTVINQDAGQLVYTKKKKYKGELIYNTLRIPRGGEYILVLSDSTKVWLNADSRLKYPVQFIGETREVFLEGEAYFEVKENAAQPFIVHTSTGKIKVLGTAFNIKDYENEQQVVTTLVNGSVKYLSNLNEDHILKPGFQLVEQRDGSDLTVKKVNLDEHIGWKDGLYIFYNATLEEIMQTVERNYDVQVTYAAERLKKLRFSGQLKKYAEVSKILEFIELGGDVTFDIDGKNILIKAKPKK